MDEFLNEVLSYVKFPFDRDNIKDELKNHILDKTDYYMEQGYDRETSERQSIDDMGDAQVIGTELNKQHNPYIGWLWKISNVLLVLFIIVNIFVTVIPLVASLGVFASVEDIPESEIVYEIKMNKRVKIDDTVTNFTKVVYDKNGGLTIFYNYYDTRLWGSGWSVGYIGEVSDNLGNKYFNGSGMGSGGIISRHRQTYNDFSKDADTLIISYDSYNRKYKIEIPLNAGGKNE
jgi:hypothetical protein